MRATLNISLPEEMKDWVDTQVKCGGFGTVSEFFRQLVRDEQQRKIRDDIDAKLLAALESPSIEVTPEWWDERRKELQRRIERRKKAKS